MNDDPRTLRIQLSEAQLVQDQLETIAAAVGAQQRFVHLNRVTAGPAVTSSLQAIETAQPIPV